MLWEMGGMGSLLYSGEHLAKLCPVVMLQADIVSDGLKYLLELSKQNA